jgi:hypothetical protein
LLANIPTSLATSFGAPPHDSKMDQYGVFVQDDWRVGNHLMLNLGMRYDYYGQMQVRPTTDVAVEIVNYEAPTDFQTLNFGPLRDPLRPYEPDGNNFAPRVGFAWTVDQEERTVIRGGVAYMFSPHLVATVRQSAANPFIPFRVTYNRTEIASRGITWPIYTDQSSAYALADAGGRRSVFSLFDPNIQVPYTTQAMASVQHSFGKTMAAEASYIRTDGRDFPLQRQFTQAFDRQTGARPNPSLGAPGGYYIDSSQTMEYNGLQTSLRKRFSNRYSWDVNYTLGKSVATQGGDLSAYYIASFENNQDFFNPEFDRGPASNDIRHRFNAQFIYELPNVNGGGGVMNGILGGWQVSGILQARSGTALRVQQPSGIDRSRPDVVPGVDLIFDDWRNRCDPRGCTFLNPDGFARVPVSTVTNATLRPGTYMLDMAYGPGALNAHMTVAKSFPLGPAQRLQVRVEAFNILNRQNYNNPELRVNNVDFGRITGAGGSRVLQFSSRLTF